MTSRAGFLGIDVGTQGVRAILIDSIGVQLGAGTCPMPAGERAGHRHEQNPLDWWDATAAAVRSCLSEADGARIEGIALDATSGTVLVADRQGGARGSALMYDDSRAGDQAAIVQRAGAELWSALGYRMQPSWALPKILWLLDQGLVADRDVIMHQSDYLVARLVGKPTATDTSHALKTGVDLRTAQWPRELLAELGVAIGCLPEVVLPGHQLGEVGAEAAAATGLMPGVPVFAGMTDGCAAQIAVAALRPGSWSSALGTTLVLKGASRELVRDQAGAVYCHRNPDGGWLPGGASSIGAGALSKAFPDASAEDLRQLSLDAASLAAPKAATYPLAGLGERFPFVSPEAHAFGPTLDGAERFAAVCHGVAFVERLSYVVLRTLGAEVNGPIAFSGGAATNQWWNQLRTDVLDRPTVVPASTQAARGMAVLAAAEGGKLADTADRMLQIADRLVPDPERSAELRPGYLRLVDALVERGWLAAELAQAATGQQVRT